MAGRPKGGGDPTLILAQDKFWEEQRERDYQEAQEAHWCHCPIPRPSGRIYVGDVREEQCDGCGHSLRPRVRSPLVQKLLAG